MAGFDHRVRFATLACVAALIAAACGSATDQASSPPGSPAASEAATPPAASPVAGASTASGPPSGTELATLVPPTDPRVALLTLLGVQDQALDPDMTGLRDRVLSQLGSAPDAPVPVPELKLASWRSGPGDAAAARPASVNGSTVLVGFLMIDMAVMGKILPSRQSAQLLAGAVKQVAGQGGRDGPDSIPAQPGQTESTPFDATADSGLRATGTMETNSTVKAERSLVTVDLDRQLTLGFSGGTNVESGTTTITIHNTASVDFCPDVGGVVPVKLKTTFTMAMPSSTVTAAIDGDYLALVDDTGNHVFTNGGGRITRVTSTGNDDVDVQVVELSLDPSGAITGGTYEGRASSQAVAAQAAGAALVDVEDAVPTIVKSAEAAWQASSCVAIQLPELNVYAGPASDGSGHKDVDPTSKTEIKAQVHQRFEHREVDLPVKLTLRAAKSIDPTRLPTTPSKFTYEAPDRPNQSNQVVLEVASKRGKSKVTMTFDTKTGKLRTTANGTIHMDAAGNVYDTTITLKQTDLTAADDGLYHGHATVDWTTTYTAPGGVCKPKTYTGTFGTEITARPDPEDPTQVFVKLSYEPGQLKPEVLVCGGKSIPFTGGTTLAPWAMLGQERPIALDGSVEVRGSIPFGSSKITIKVTKPPQPS